MKCVGRHTTYFLRSQYAHFLHCQCPSIYLGISLWYAVGGHFGRMELGDLCVRCCVLGKVGKGGWYQYVDR